MEVGGYMDNRDDWPDSLIEGELDSFEEPEAEARPSAERIAREARSMNAMLSAMAGQLSEGLTAAESGKAAEVADAVPSSPQRMWRSRTMIPLAAAAAIAALILMRGRGIEERGRPDVFAGAPRTPSMMAEMDVEADRPFVVFPTGDPGIAVVWLLNPEESDE